MVILRSHCYQQLVLPCILAEIASGQKQAANTSVVTAMSQYACLTSSDDSSSDELPALGAALLQRGVHVPSAIAAVSSRTGVVDLRDSDDSSSPNSAASVSGLPVHIPSSTRASSRGSAVLAAEAAMQAAAPGGRSRAGTGRKRGRAAAGGSAASSDLAAAAEGASAKVRRSHTVHWSRQVKGSFAAQEIAVQLEASLAATALGSALTAALQEDKYTVLPPATGVPAGLIQWYRRTQQPDGSLTHAGPHNMQPFLLQVLRGKALVPLVQDGPTALLQHTSALTAALPEGARVLLLAFQVGSYVSALQRKAQAQHSMSAVTRGTVDAALAQAYIIGNVQTRQCNDTKHAAEYVCSLTRAVAEAPYRTRKTALACVAKVRVSKALRAAVGGDAGSAASASVASGGGGSVRSGGSFMGGGASELTAQDMWCAQLQMIPGVSASKYVPLFVATRSLQLWLMARRRLAAAHRCRAVRRAVNIVRRFPSFQSLMQVYEDPSIGDADKAALLEVSSLSCPPPYCPSHALLSPPPPLCRAHWTPSASPVSSPIGSFVSSQPQMAMP